MYIITDLCFLYSHGNILGNGPRNVDVRPLPQASTNVTHVGNTLYG